MSEEEKKQLEMLILFNSSTYLVDRWGWVQARSKEVVENMHSRGLLEIRKGTLYRYAVYDVRVTNKGREEYEREIALEALAK
jgi:hypothetical protein